jgi:hypothetical protein
VPGPIVHKKQSFMSMNCKEIVLKGTCLHGHIKYIVCSIIRRVHALTEAPTVNRCYYFIFFDQPVPALINACHATT